MTAFFFIWSTIFSSPTDILPRNSVSEGFSPSPTVDAIIMRLLLHHRVKVNINTLVEYIRYCSCLV